MYLKRDSLGRAEIMGAGDGFEGVIDGDEEVTEIPLPAPVGPARAEASPELARRMYQLRQALGAERFAELMKSYGPQRMFEESEPGRSLYPYLSGAKPRASNTTARASASPELARRMFRLKQRLGAERFAELLKAYGPERLMQATAPGGALYASSRRGKWRGRRRR